MELEWSKVNNIGSRISALTSCQVTAETIGNLFPIKSEALGLELSLKKSLFKHGQPSLKLADDTSPKASLQATMCQRVISLVQFHLVGHAKIKAF